MCDLVKKQYKLANVIISAFTLPGAMINPSHAEYIKIFSQSDNLIKVANTNSQS